MSNQIVFRISSMLKNHSGKPEILSCLYLPSVQQLVHASVPFVIVTGYNLVRQDGPNLFRKLFTLRVKFWERVISSISLIVEKDFPKFRNILALRT